MGLGFGGSWIEDVIHGLRLQAAGHDGACQHGPMNRMHVKAQGQGQGQGQAGLRETSSSGRALWCVCVAYSIQ